MIKAQTIIQQLQAVLPLHTDLFNKNTFSITSLAISGSTVTATTSVAHGLATNNLVTIKDAKTPIDVSSLAFVASAGIGNTGGIVTATTAINHDFTEGFNQKVVMVGAAEGDYNETFDLATTVNRKKLTYLITTNPTTPATGSPQILYEFVGAAGGYNGVKAITVTGATTFTYVVTQTITNNAQGTITAANGLRISGAVSWEKAVGAYTAQSKDKLWGFVVLGDPFTSKDRHVSTDATSTLATGDEYRLRTIVPFSVFIITPSTDGIAGLAARDLMEDVRVALYKSILRVRFDTVLSEAQVYVSTANGDRFALFVDGYYMHEFEFQTVVDITIDDTVDPAYSVAFRDIDLFFKDPLQSDGDDIIMQTEDLSLDEESV